MSAVQEGGKLASQAKDLSATFEPGVVTAPVDRDNVQGGAAAEQFPRKFGGRDPYDDVMRMRQQLVTDGQGNTPFGQLEYTDDVARWAMRKEQVSEAADFDSWFGKNYHKSDLASRAFAQEVNPEYYAARERDIMTRAQEAAKLKIIQLRGPRTKEELMKVWLIQSGRVELPADWDRIGPSYDYSANPGSKSQQAFKRGLFTLPSFTNREQRARRARAEQNPFGDGTDAASRNTFPFQGGNNANAGNTVFSNAPNSVAARFMDQVRDQ